MTQKKINNIIRLCLYLLPFIMLFIFAIVNKGTGLSIAEIRIFMSDFINYVNNIIIPHNFWVWMRSNIIGVIDGAVFSSTINYFGFAYFYSMYLLYVEIFILFKNVLCYVIQVANAWLERGVNVGKGKE